MFGRRKPGFTREEIVTEYENEYNEDLERKREEEMAEEIVEEKIDLLDFLDEGLEEELEYEEPVEEEKSKEDLLWEYISMRSLGSLLTSRKDLEEDEELDETLEKMYEKYSDIATIEGQKDLYYYSTSNMSDNYAMIAMLVEEKDLARIISEMVRWNAKTYPCPTPIYYFQNSPYNYSMDQIDMALEKIKSIEDYKDIESLTTKNNKLYLYSTLHMSRKYANALAESTEYGEAGYIY